MPQQHMIEERSLSGPRDEAYAGKLGVNSSSKKPRKWHPSKLTTVITFFAIAGIGLGLYPMTAAWVTSFNQSKIVGNYQNELVNTRPSSAEQLTAARKYNDAMIAGVVLGSGANVPEGSGISTDKSLDYNKILSVNKDGLMARVIIPGIKVDIPVYHGTSDEVLLRGAGHLEGSHLPVGGIGTRSVITAHRGLANATMFTDLDGVKVGDMFTVEVFSEVLSYKVSTIDVISPDATDTLRSDPNKDQVTLITCTPLGINSHRIVVTGERVTPTPIESIQEAAAAPSIPGFPWWAVYGGAGLLLVAIYNIRQGLVDGTLRNRERGASMPRNHRVRKRHSASQGAQTIRTTVSPAEVPRA